MDGTCASLTVERNGETIELGATSTFELQAGDLVEIRLPGGGGWGDPILRDRKAVGQDLADEVISAAFAARHYGFSAEAAASMDRFEGGNDAREG
jgi:N-methylhydantoinase B